MVLFGVSKTKLQRIIKRYITWMERIDDNDSEVAKKRLNLSIDCLDKILELT